MFSAFKSKQTEVLSHWYAPVPNFKSSTQEFYAAVERELIAQQVPGLEISRVEFSEGGLLSDKREYLRMARERLVFDICAAPFGVNYFFSCRFAEFPAKVSLFGIAILLFAAFISFTIALHFLELFLTCVFGVAVLAIGIYTLRNLVSLGLADLDASLLKLPLFGAVYERFFRKETYFREDTRLMYLTVVEGVVKRLVEEQTAAKGIKLLTQYEYAPILKDLYKPSPLRSTEKRETAA